MQIAVPTPVFRWPRGERSRWKAIRAQSSGARVGDLPDVQITYGARWPSLAEPDDDRYEPLSDPHIFEAFAAVGRLAHNAGARFDQPAYAEMIDSEIVMARYAPDANPMLTALRRAQIAVAMDTPDVIAAVLRFVRNYGPLDYSESWAMEPETIGGETALHFEPSMSVRWFVKRAAEMDEALRLSAEDKPHPSWLNDVIREHLLGTHPTVFNARDLGTDAKRDAYGFTCDSLLAALWWQFYQADAGGRAWRQCKGCLRLFVQKRSDQEYHDAACRNRANVRRSAQSTEKAASKRAPKKGATQ